MHSCPVRSTFFVSPVIAFLFVPCDCTPPAERHFSFFYSWSRGWGGRGPGGLFMGRRASRERPNVRLAPLLLVRHACASPLAPRASSRCRSPPSHRRGRSACPHTLARSAWYVCVRTFFLDIHIHALFQVGNNYSISSVCRRVRARLYCMHCSTVCFNTTKCEAR